MICNRLDDGWELIYQRAHALLAAMVVEAWNSDTRPTRWFETLNAIAQHDNGWQEWESGCRLHANGEPIDFRDTPIDDIVAQAARAVLRAHHQDMYAGLLVSRHIAELHESRRGQSDTLAHLLDEQRHLRDRWRRMLAMSQADEDHAYAFLNWGDVLSLLLCCRMLEDGSTAPVGVIARTSYTATLESSGAIAISPWPYPCDRVDVGVDTFQLHQVAFESPHELSRLLLDTPPHRRTWNLQPASS